MHYTANKQYPNNSKPKDADERELTALQNIWAKLQATPPSRVPEVNGHYCDEESPFED